MIKVPKPLLALTFGAWALFLWFVLLPAIVGVRP